jgi:outer membrane PBP1 activator LpoA protein
LFAFGYDSLALIDNLAQLSIFAHMSVNGLSGVLSIDQNQTLVRELSSLSITKNNLDN